MTTPVLSLIERLATARAALREDAQRAARLRRLQEWQIARLRATYDDFYSQPRYRDALDFFMQDLYGPHELQQRDEELARVMHTWHRVLPARGIAAITRALELEWLSLELDLAMLAFLDDSPITQTTYAQAYRSVERRRDREQQIELILEAGRSIDELIGHTWMGQALRVARRPAQLTGVASLHRFLERGYGAFLKMKHAEELLHAIEERETAIMRRLLAGEDDPFGSVRSGATRRKA